jgi:hypothetical protein
MKLQTQSFVEHRNRSAQQALSTLRGDRAAGTIVPGASTCCVGCTSTSCGAIVRVRSSVD